MSLKEEKKEELVKLVSYMVHHNASHNKELSDLALQLKDCGFGSAWEKSMKAVEFFSKGNALLEEVLKDKGD